MHLPPILHTNQVLTAEWVNQLLNVVRSIIPHSSATVRVRTNSTGTIFEALGVGGRGGGSATSQALIWQPYQHTPDPDNPTSADWRTIRVGRGFVNNIYPANTTNVDDPDGDGTDIVLPASAVNKFWLKCTIATTDDAEEGKVTAVSLENGTDWWEGYPTQPNGNSETGAPPDKFYLNLYTIETGSDSDTESDYHQLTLPTTWSANNYWVDEVSFGQPVCIDGRTIIQQRMSARRV